MPHHVVVDGSNLATEGRAMPSLAQLNEAVLAFIEEHPDALITVVVDATFGHRIDPTEVKEFDAAISNNELVAPPAGAIGRGDAFVLSIANKVSATILSNDSFQEFHGSHPWLFDEGRLVGGKPVPHIGWVFVNRVPVRGPVSRTAVKEAKRKKAAPGTATVQPVPAKAGGRRLAHPEASKPMPIPKAPPPGAVLKGQGKHVAAPRPAHVPDGAPPAPAPAPAPAATAVNDLLPFLSFVEHHPLGTRVDATVESYSSHGAYVRLVGDVVGYLPMRKMADPAPRSAREFLTIGDQLTLVVESFAPTRRSIDLATVAMATVAAPAPAPAKRARGKAAKAVETTTVDELEVAPAPARGRRTRVATPATADTTSAAPAAVEPAAVEPAAVDTAAPGRGRRGKRAAASADAAVVPAVEAPMAGKGARAARRGKVVEAPAAAEPDVVPAPPVMTGKRAAATKAVSKQQPKQQPTREPAERPAKRAKATSTEQPAKQPAKRSKTAATPAGAKQEAAEPARPAESEPATATRPARTKRVAAPAADAPLPADAHAPKGRTKRAASAPVEPASPAPARPKRASRASA